MEDPRRALPAVGTLLELPGIRALSERAPRTLVSDAVRRVVEQARRSRDFVPPDERGWETAIAAELAALERPSLLPVYNATGVVLHTNLGRAPLAQAAIDAIARTASGACNLEYDLQAGTRGSRYVHCVSLLTELTGAEDAIVVNNCAAALVLALNTTAEGREAIVSRGELIEIGGSFRIPDIMAKSGATLVEVGTTNRTHAEDYKSALGAGTGAIVKVHRSNFELRGFVTEVELSELAPIAGDAAVPLLYDFGSGLLLALDDYGLKGEPTVQDGIRAGADLLLMSGDKLLGGPQAGIIVGRKDAVARCRANPLARALRVDKLTLAALEATLALYRDPTRAAREVPALAMLTASAEAIETRARRLRATLQAHGIEAVVEESEATVGGGAFPSSRIPSFALSLRGEAGQLERRLRAAPMPIIGRIASARLLLDIRSVPERLDDDLARAILDAIAS